MLDARTGSGPEQGCDFARCDCHKAPSQASKLLLTGVHVYALAVIALIAANVRRSGALAGS